MKGLQLTITIFATIFVIAIASFAIGAIYIINEGQQVVITQFGKPVGNPVTLAGLHFKKPFIQEAHYFEKRLLDWDGDPNQIPTKDKKYI
ncbi:MAG: SPFH domain-containing protein, partial [Candidatus Omnitrophota bacterium]